MAIINSYPLATPKGEDLLIATQVPDPNDPNVNEYSTKSFTVDTLGSYIVTSTSGITGSGTVNTLAMFTPNSTTVGDSIVSQTNTGIDVGGGVKVTKDEGIVFKNIGTLGNAIKGTSTGDTIFTTVAGSAPYTESTRMTIYNNGDIELKKDLNDAGTSAGIVNLNLKGGTTSLYGGGATINAIGGTSDYASLGINVYQNIPTYSSPLGKLEGSLTYNFNNKWEFDADATGNPGTVTTTYEWKKAGVTEMYVYDNGLRIPNGELLIGTTVSDTNNPFRIKAKGDNGIRLVDPNTANDPYLQFYRDPSAGGAYINTGNSTSITFGIPTGSLPQLVNFYGDVNLQGALNDGSTPGSPGTDGQVLTSHTFPQGRRTKWESLSSILEIKSQKVIVSTAELRNLHTTPKILIDVTAGNPKEICQVYSVVFGVAGNNLTDNLVFPNDINIESDAASPWKYVIPQSVANEQAVNEPYYNPSLTAGRIGLDSDVVLSSAGAAVETGTATTTMTIWITYRIFNIAD